MPFTGGYSPSPERTGGGDAGDAAPRLQRIFESIALRRGKAFDQTDESIVGAENMAYARAIDGDLFGANERFVNEMNPVTSTAKGLLPRWEKIFSVPPLPGDAETVRQNRVYQASLKFSKVNGTQGIADACTAVLGSLFVGLTLITPSEANTWWPGLQGTTAKITSFSTNQYTIQGLANVPTDAAGKTIVVANCANPANQGFFMVQSRVSATSVVYINNGLGLTVPEYGVAGSSGSPTVVWALANQVFPWTSTTMHILVLVNPTAVAGYVNADGTLNGAFFAKMNQLNPVLDWLLPADMTFDWYVPSSHGAIGWYLDEPNLDIESFDS